MPLTSHDFVGREAELKAIEQAVSSDGLQLVCFYGPGGIGKTSILREIARRYGNREDIYSARIIDFYKPGTHTATGLMQRLARRLEQIKKSAFESFREVYHDFERMSVSGVSPARLRAVSEEATNKFFDCYNSIAQDRRLVVLIDTVEMVQKAGVIQWLKCNVLRFDNTVLVLAGRGERLLYNDLVSLVRDERIQLLSLQPFDLSETQELFSISDIGGSLPLEAQAKVQMLSRGHPILLTLALDWKRVKGDEASNELTPTVAQYTIEELKSMDGEALETVRSQFEHELVESLRDLKEESLTLIHMAYVHRRFNAEILAWLMSIGAAEAQRRLDAIRDYSFVKYFEDSGECYLHDEMRRLIVQYIGREIDRGWGLRTELALRMAELTPEERHATRLLYEGETHDLDLSRLSYYGRKLWDINQRLVHLSGARHTSDRKASSAELISLRRILEAERVYYWLTADRDSGLALYREAFIDDAWTHQRNAHELKQTERDLARDDLSWEYPVRELEFEQAMIALMVESDPERCVEILDGIDLQSTAANDSISDAALASYCWTYKSIAFSTYDVNRALDAAKVAVKLSQNQEVEKQFAWLLDLARARAYHALALANSLAERYAQAVDCYQSSLFYSRNGSAMVSYADSLNSMAYVYGLLDQCLTAKPLCERGLGIRQRLGQDYSVGLSFNTLGLIYLFDNRLDMAQTKCEVALSIFEEHGDLWGLGLTHVALARIMNVLAERTISELTQSPMSTEQQRILELLQRGSDHAEEAKKAFEVSNSLTRLAEVHQTMASLYRMWANAAHDDDRDKFLQKAHAMYSEAQGEYEASGIYLEQAFVLERWSRVYFDQGDYDGWIHRIQDAENIAIRQTGDLRSQDDIGLVDRREFLHVWGKIERAYGVYASLHDDLEEVALHFVQACAFLEEYSDHSQTYRDTLDIFTDILGTLSKTELELIARRIMHFHHQRRFLNYKGIVERIKAATGVQKIIQHKQESQDGFKQPSD